MATNEEKKAAGKRKKKEEPRTHTTVQCLDGRDPKKPGPKPKRKSTPLISRDTYNLMYKAYLDRQSVRHVAKTAGVSQQTANKYVNHGDPKRGMMSLRDRMAKIQDMTRQQQDYDVARAWGEFQKAARGIFMKNVQRINDMKPEELDANKIPDNLNKLLTVVERTFGGAEHTHEIKGKYSDWTVDELRGYLENGIEPNK